MRSWLPVLVWLAGCGDNLAPTLDYDPAVEAADVSILYPLPDTIDLLIKPAEEGAFGTLFPEALFPTAIGPVDIGTSYGDLRLVALRLDPCSARKNCNAEVRAIFQPVIVAGSELTVADGAIHVFYDMPRTELVFLLEQILALKKLHGEGIAYGSTLGPNPILVATGLDGDFARELHKLVLQHLGESRIERFTEQNHQIPARDRWDFYLFGRVGGDLVRQNIATLTTTDEQQITGQPADPLVAGGIAGVSPVLDSPVVAVVDETRPPDVTDAIRTGFARAVELQDPTKQTSESVDCVSCHLAEGARRVGSTEYGLTTTAAFQSDRSLDYQRDLGAVTNLRMFAYHGRFVSVTQRVANESAVIAENLQQLLPQ